MGGVVVAVAAQRLTQQGVVVGVLRLASERPTMACTRSHPEIGDGASASCSGRDFARDRHLRALGLGVGMHEAVLVGEDDGLHAVS